MLGQHIVAAFGLGRDSLEKDLTSSDVLRGAVQSGDPLLNQSSQLFFPQSSALLSGLQHLRPKHDYKELRSQPAKFLKRNVSRSHP
jgi:hypothetical protein